MPKAKTTRLKWTASKEESLSSTHLVGSLEDGIVDDFVVVDCGGEFGAMGPYEESDDGEKSNHRFSTQKEAKQFCQSECNRILAEREKGNL